MKNFFSQFNSLKWEGIYLSQDHFQTENSFSEKDIDPICKATAFPVEESNDH